MFNLDIGLLDKAVGNVKDSLKDGLISLDIWDRETGLGLAGHNPNPAATALFNKITTDIAGILRDSGFPGLSRYYLLDLKESKTVLIGIHSDSLLSGTLLDSSKASLGIVLGVVVPRLMADVKAALA